MLKRNSLEEKKARSNKTIKNTSEKISLNLQKNTFFITSPSLLDFIQDMVGEEQEVGLVQLGRI